MMYSGPVSFEGLSFKIAFLVIDWMVGVLWRVEFEDLAVVVIFASGEM